ncbi:hypothetical protein DM01DRAFT_313925 [Hesseltinella vesiculosa]|uniref:Uncharacterized protein n=1 Tax=Hesseltinella vesiculosa TaxID=101127 RepID=A0A1X2G5X9_9FUNG|nr:hypothetical protein DM01DRAFT_313925 [Hesseltinella vesiculosa]
MKEFAERKMTLEQGMFLLGFVFPPAWFIGSMDGSCCQEYEKEQDPWRTRCRMAATLFLTLCIVTVVLLMVFKPSTFGLLTSNTAAQTSSATQAANRPGVPINGSTTWDDTMAGLVLGLP